MLLPLTTFTLRTLGTLFINLLTAIALALVLEFVLSLGMSNPASIPDFLLPHYRWHYASSDRNIFQVTDCAEYDPDFYYRFKPGSCAFSNREFNVMNHFNSAGLRDDETSLDSPSIVIFGDSFTAGWGVPQTDAFPQVLEGLSQRKVLNAGTSSFGTAREVKLLEKLNLDSIQTVIFQYHPNDFAENMKSIKNNFVLPISPRHHYDSVKENIADRNRYYPFKYLANISKSIILSNLRTDEDINNDTLEARVFLDILLNSRVREIAQRIVVFKIDTDDNDNGFVDAIDALLTNPKYASLNISTVRLNGVLDKEDYFILDPHINSQGQAKVASVLWDNLKAAPELVMPGRISATRTASKKRKAQSE